MHTSTYKLTAEAFIAIRDKELIGYMKQKEADHYMKTASAQVRNNPNLPHGQVIQALNQEGNFMQHITALLIH